MTPMLPPRFLGGGTTGAHQTEGNNVASDWWAAETPSMRRFHLSLRGGAPYHPDAAGMAAVAKLVLGTSLGRLAGSPAGGPIRCAGQVCSAAIRVRATRELMPSFSNAWRRCPLTVWGET
jgi:hypothetical protein